MDSRGCGVCNEETKFTREKLQTLKAHNEETILTGGPLTEELN